MLWIVCVFFRRFRSQRSTYFCLIVLTFYPFSMLASFFCALPICVLVCLPKKKRCCCSVFVRCHNNKNKSAGLCVWSGSIEPLSQPYLPLYSGKNVNLAICHTFDAMRKTTALAQTHMCAFLIFSLDFSNRISISSLFSKQISQLLLFFQLHIVLFFQH